MKKIRMIGFDLDGTLLDSKKRLSQENIEALAAAAKRGVIILPATGRPESGVPKEVLEIPGVRYLLSSNGARIVDLTTKELLYGSPINAAQSIHLARRLHVLAPGLWELYDQGNCYVDKATYHVIEHPDMTPQRRDYILATRIFTENLLEHIEKNQIAADKFQVFYPTKEEGQRMLEALQKEPGLAISCSTTFNWEINAENSGKGNGLLALGKLLGIQQEEILVLGDSKNDWNMLQMAGYPVVMENADDATKALGKFITRSNDQNGVAYAIKKFVLGND